LAPLIVTSHISEGIGKRLISRRVHLTVDFVSRQRSKPYVNRGLFLEYIKTIFIRYFNKLRNSEEFEICEEVLVIANYSHHVSDDVVSVLTHAQVRIVTFTRHTTHIFQVLDVVLFGALKKHPNGLKMSDEKQPASAFLLTVYHDFKQTMIETHIWGPL
jgi:hypothetical protein